MEHQEEYSSADSPVSLRRLTWSDKARLARLINNKKIWDKLRDYIPYPYSEKDAERFIEITLQEDPPVNFAITFNGELAGVTGLSLQTDIHRLTAEVGYWIGEPCWNKGIATEAVRLIVKYGFEKLGLERIEALVFEGNTASCRVLEKCGFLKEGVFRNAVIKNGKLLNEFRYGIIKEDME